MSYQLVVVNNGPKDEPAATLTDTLPAGFTVTDIDNPDCDLTDLTVSCDLGPLTVGASAVVTVTGTLPADTPDPTSNTATVSGSPGSVDPNPDNNTGTALVEVNTPPVATDDTASVPPGETSVTIPVLPNDSDPDGDAITVTTAIVQPPANGSVVVNEGGSLTYTSTNPTFKGTDTVTYEICDDRGGCDTATVTITVPNKPPVATDDSTGTSPGVPVIVDVRANDTDPNGDPLGPPTITTPPATGTAVVNADGTITYTPPPGTPSGTVVTFEYEVCEISDPTACDTATVTVVVSNDAPVAVDDFTSTPFETPIDISVDDLLFNDREPNLGDAITISSVQDPQGGTVVLDPDTGVVTFTPADDFVGRASFTYTITDLGGATSTATVYVDVLNSPPTATDDTATTPPSGVVDIPILTNDTDAETPDQLTATLTGLPSSGSAKLNDDGTVTYTADPGFKGVVTIPYSVCDPQGLCDDAVITVTVPNAPPTTVSEERTVVVNQPVNVPVGANDSDPNGDPVTVTGIVTLPASGTATLNPDGTITYTPNLNFTGTDTVFYEVCDDDTPPACSVATLTIDVVNQPPQAVADAFRTPHQAGQPTTVPLTGLLDSDTDPDGQPLTISNFTQPTDGTVTQNPDGTLTYTAPPGFVGVAVFTYEVTDGSGGASRTTVVIEVGNEPPVATDDSATTPAGTPVSINVLGNDTDPDGDPLTVTEVTPASNGSVTIGADGSIVYTPNPGFTGTDTFSYTVCDPYGLCDTAVVTVTVAPGPGPEPTPTPTTPSTPAPSPRPGPPLASTGLAGGGLVPWVVGLLLTGIGLTAISRRRMRGHRSGPTTTDD